MHWRFTMISFSSSSISVVAPLSTESLYSIKTGLVVNEMGKSLPWLSSQSSGVCPLERKMPPQPVPVAGFALTSILPSPCLCFGSCLGTGLPQLDVFSVWPGWPWQTGLWGDICCWHGQPALPGGSRHCHHLPAGPWPCCQPGALSWLCSLSCTCRDTRLGLLPLPGSLLPA